ncbi:MAG: 50S ribosomal protein L21 [Anaerovoracaceae bacterium]
MYAVIETGGKQYRVTEGDVITVEKLDVNAGDTITFDKVIVMGDGSDLQIGTPYVDAKVFGEVVENGKGKKVVIFKYKAKKDYRKKQGHRQPYTMVKITGIGGVAPKATVKAKEETVEATEVTEVKTASMSMKKDELIAFAEENNIKVDAKATKQVILDTINENLK